MMRRCFSAFIKTKNQPGSAPNEIPWKRMSGLSGVIKVLSWTWSSLVRVAGIHQRPHLDGA